MELIILPIEVSDSDKLRAIYCTPDGEPVTIKIDHAKDASSFSAIKRMYQELGVEDLEQSRICLLYTSPSPRDRQKSRMPSSA